MKILVVSHNVFNLTNNMGKTLMSYFSGVDPTEIAQLYIHDDLPEVKGICNHYFRFTDKDALKSIFHPHVQGVTFEDKEIETNDKEQADVGAIDALVFKIAAERSVYFYLIRNFVWKISRWHNNKLKKWLNDFSPDVIFYASSDFKFMYDIVSRLTDDLKIPMVVACVDDYYMYVKNANSHLGHAVYKSYMHSVHKTMNRAFSIMTICDSMADVYRELFHKPCHTLYTAVQYKQLNCNTESSCISYIGNLQLDRYKQLMDLGCAVASIDSELKINVYSGEKDSQIIYQLKHAQGICFKGFIKENQVHEVMENSMLVIHTESFDETIIDRVRYSVSTKIPESLMYGPCLLAYGPEGVESIQYLKKHGAAYVITSKDKLEEGLREILWNAALREEIVANARKLAMEHHTIDRNVQTLRRCLQEAVDG